MCYPRHIPVGGYPGFRIAQEFCYARSSAMGAVGIDTGGLHGSGTSPGRQITGPLSPVSGCWVKVPTPVARSIGAYIDLQPP